MSTNESTAGKKRIRWETVVVASAFVLGAWAAFIWGPAEHRSEILVGLTTLGVVIAAAMRKAYGIAVVALCVALPLGALGCGASAATREAYAAEVARCVAGERAIVDREGTTLEEDQRDLAIERDRCDAALAAIGGGQ